MKFLSNYENSSGQCINSLKSCFLTSKHMPKRAISKLADITGFQHKNGSMKYLGVPLFKGRQKIKHFNYLIDKVTSKLQGWKANYLSQAGRLVLIKSFLSAIPIYTVNALFIPQYVINSIEKICANFLWKGIDGNTHRHWISWGSICKPYEEGGLGIKSLSEVQTCFIMKLIWNIIYGNSLWSSFARTKFLKGHLMDCNTPFPSGIRKKQFFTAQNFILKGSRSVIFYGSKTNLLKDNWISEEAIIKGIA